MVTKISIFTAVMVACTSCAHAQDDEYIRSLPADAGQVGTEIDALDPVFVYVINKRGAPVLFVCEEDRGCIEGEPKVLEVEELRKAEAVLWTRVADPATSRAADPCDEFTTTSGKKIKKCYDE